jgi:hypothetical protein
MEKKMYSLLIVLSIIIGLLIVYFFKDIAKMYKKSKKEGMESMEVPAGYTTIGYFEGPQGATALIKVNTSGNKIIVYTDSSGTTYVYYYDSQEEEANNVTVYTYLGPNGSKALLVEKSDGSYTLRILGANNNVLITLTSTSNTSNTVNSDNNYDNYNHYSKSAYPTIYYGPDGSVVRLLETANDNTLVVTTKNGETQIYYISNDSSNAYQPGQKSDYYGPNGGSAKIVTASNGKKAVEITQPNGSKTIYYSDNIYNYNSQDTSMNEEPPYYTGSGTDINEYEGPLGGTLNTVRGPNNNTVGVYSSPYGNSTLAVNTNNSNNDAYMSSLPPGIPRSQILPGQEDLYILKSEVVPPVCPKCPKPIIYTKNDNTKCPPCPPCARCPEPAFDCKKVPNYDRPNPDYLPMPVLNSFSSFGM